jgi:site-specific recombinase XerD
LNNIEKEFSNVKSTMNSALNHIIEKNKFQKKNTNKFLPTEEILSILDKRGVNGSDADRCISAMKSFFKIDSMKKSIEEKDKMILTFRNNLKNLNIELSNLKSKI